MIEKMTAWECNKCRRHCIHFESGEIKDPSMMESVCLYKDFHKTTRYEIIERKPDYETMAERGDQFGQFSDSEEGCNYWGYLKEYNPKDNQPFTMDYIIETKEAGSQDLFKLFTPCTEPVPLDLSAMELK